MQKTTFFDIIMYLVICATIVIVMCILFILVHKHYTQPPTQTVNYLRIV